MSDFKIQRKGPKVDPIDLDDARLDAMRLLLETGFPREIEGSCYSWREQGLLRRLKRRLTKFNAHTGQWKR